jgi:hypothetical protein
MRQKLNARPCQIANQYPLTLTPYYFSYPAAAGEEKEDENKIAPSSSGGMRQKMAQKGYSFGGY